MKRSARFFMQRRVVLSSGPQFCSASLGLGKVSKFCEEKTELTDDEWLFLRRVRQLPVHLGHLVDQLPGLFGVIDRRLGLAVIILEQILPVVL
jgi:hypothetical protein